MSPLRKRIAYKKKSSFPALRFVIYLIIFAAAVYILFYHRFEDRTIYERVVGFFRSEIEKSPSISIVNADKEVKKVVKGESQKEGGKKEERSPAEDNSQKDEIEEVIRKKLEGK